MFVKIPSETGRYDSTSVEFYLIKLAVPGYYALGFVYCIPCGSLWTWLNILSTVAATLQYIFMAWCLVKHRDNFTFTL
jgi:hypothetical protein